MPIHVVLVLRSADLWMLTNVNTNCLKSAPFGQLSVTRTPPFVPQAIFLPAARPVIQELFCCRDSRKPRAKPVLNHVFISTDALHRDRDIAEHSACTGLLISTGTAPPRGYSRGSVAHPDANVASSQQALTHVFQSRKGRAHKEDLRKPFTWDRAMGAVADHRRRENSHQGTGRIRHRFACDRRAGSRWSLGLMAASRPTVVLPIAEYSVLGNIDDATVEHVVQVVRHHVHANGQTREREHPGQSSLGRKRDRGIRRSVPPGRRRPGAAAV